jgi:hypothetical protein
MNKLLYGAIGFVIGITLLISRGTTYTGSGWSSGGATNIVSDPSIISTTSNALALVTITNTWGNENIHKRTIQNVGTVPVLYCLGTTASATNYHGVLAPGSVARDGLGSVLDVSTWRGSVSVAVESGTGVVAAFELIK